MKNKNYLILFIFFILMASFLFIAISIKPVLAEVQHRTFKTDIPECNSACPLVDTCDWGSISRPKADPLIYKAVGSCEHLDAYEDLEKWLSCMKPCHAEREKNNAICKTCRDRAKSRRSSDTPSSSETSTPVDDKDETLTDSDTKISEIQQETDILKAKSLKLKREIAELNQEINEIGNIDQIREILAQGSESAKDGLAKCEGAIKAQI